MGAGILLTIYSGISSILIPFLALIFGASSAGIPIINVQKNQEFGELLKEVTGLDVAYQNERLTTVSAHNILNTVDVRGKKRKAVVDAVSAVLILEDYMNSVKS